MDKNKLNKDYFINNVQKQFIQDGNNMYKKNGEYIVDLINSKRSKLLQPVKLNNVQNGMFYFLMYDLSGKTTNMEKFSPILMLDFIDSVGTKKLYGLSLNFIPVAIRTIFFNIIFNYNLDVLQYNMSKDLNKEYALKNINFVNIYNMLKEIGFEWAIREFNILLLDKIYKVSTNLITEYITMSTSMLTKVDDNKLVQIWQKKIESQNEREQKLIKSIIGDYKKMSDELNKKIINLNEQNNNLSKSIQTLKNK